MQEIKKQNAKRSLNIIEAIKNNVNNSNPELALYLYKSLTELGENPEELTELKIISEAIESSNDEAINSATNRLKNILANKTQAKESTNNKSHFSGYAGGATMIITIFAIVHFCIQSEKIKRQSTLNVKFSPWNVSYYCNEKLEGQPCSVETKDQINIDWKGNPPATNVPHDHFSVKFESCLSLDKPEQEIYFLLGADDGYRLSIDNKIIRESWKVQGFEEKMTSHSISKGRHRLKLEYFQSGGASRINIKAGTHRLNLDDIQIDKEISNQDC